VSTSLKTILIRTVFKVAVLVLVVLLLASAGCGDVTKMTDAQVDKDVEVKAKYIDMFSELAQKHGFSYVIKFDIGGEPSVSQELKFKLDTDVSLEMIAHGNAAAGRTPDPPIE
jgi:hypothetical protein